MHQSYPSSDMPVDISLHQSSSLIQILHVPPPGNFLHRLWTTIEVNSYPSQSDPNTLLPIAAGINGVMFKKKRKAFWEQFIS